MPVPTTLAVLALFAALAAATAWLFLSRRRIRASEEQFRHLFENSLQAQMLLRGDELVAMNRAALDMLGLRDRSDVVGRTPIDFSPETQPCGTNSREKARELIDRAYAQGKSEFTWRHRATDGREFDVHASLLIVKVGGEPLVFCVSRDISAEQAAQAELDQYRRRLEALVEERTAQLIEAKAQAEAANAAKGAFLANMSHEIRTPLNAVLGYAQLLQQEIKDGEQRAELRQIELAGNHLLCIVNDVLDIAKVESGKLTLEVAPLEVDVLIAGVRSILAERASSKGVVLRSEVAPALLGVKVLGDLHRLRQILLNLAGNAIKFTERGEVSIKATRVECDESRMEVRFEVRDTGIGISAEDQARLFNPFEQAQASTTRRYGGTGLGLAITRHLVVAMNGHYGVSSEPERGSVFWFQVPLARCTAPEDAPDAEAAEPALRQGARVLLVEDNEVNQVLARALLLRMGLQVAVADDGAQAVAAFARGEFDVVLMDLHMPVMDGLEATRRIRALPAGEAVPIVAMTASAFEEDRLRCFEAGMNEHISKPIVASVLKRTLAQWLRAAPEPVAPASPQDA